MLKISEVELKPTDILTILFALSVGYGLILKVAFFNFIGLPWLVSTLTPTLIFYTTIKVFFQLVIGVAIGIFLAKNYNGVRNPYYVFVFLVVLLISGIPAFSLSFTNSIFLIKYIDELISFHFILYCSYQGYLIENNRIVYFHYGGEASGDLKNWFTSSPKFLTFIQFYYFR